MDVLKLPFLREIESASRVLIAGAGGGFDVFSGLPLYFALQTQGAEVHLANLTFSNLYGADGRRLAPAVLEVTADSGGSSQYFPERCLAEWFRTQGKEVPIHCFERTGVVPLTEAYRALAKELRIDTVILVDGGTDSLMRGDEASLATPEEDAASILAADALNVERKLLACTAFGVDTYHGVCHYQFLEGVSELIRGHAYLGAFSLTDEMPEVRRYRAACDAVFAAMPTADSTVTRMILAALEGRYGNYDPGNQSRDSTMWINPLMPFYWCFQLSPVAARLQYRDAIVDTRTYGELTAAIAQFRGRHPAVRDWQDIPA